MLLESPFSSDAMKSLVMFQLLTPSRMQGITKSVVPAVLMFPQKVLLALLLSHPNLYLQAQLRILLLCSYFADPVEELGLQID